MMVVGAFEFVAIELTLESRSFEKTVLEELFEE
jgi:hypothetical protein